jgi:cell division protein FtsB
VISEPLHSVCSAILEPLRIVRAAIAQRFKSVRAAIKKCMRSNFKSFAQYLKMFCAMSARSLVANAKCFKSIMKLLQSVCVVLAYGLQSDYAAIQNIIAQRELCLQSECKAFAQQFQIDCKAFAQLLQSDSKAITERLQSDYGAIAKRLRGDCKAITLRLRSVCEAVAQQFRFIFKRFRFALQEIARHLCIDCVAIA